MSEYNFISFGLAFKLMISNVKFLEPNIIYKYIVIRNLDINLTNKQKIFIKEVKGAFFEEQKNTKIKLARKINNFFFLIVSTFLIFIMISLYKTYFSEAGKKNFNKSSALIDRGRILDRNGEIIATNIKTKDLYIDTRKVLDN